MIQDNNERDSGTRVRFEEEQPTQSSRPGRPKMIRWVIRYSGGLIKSKRQAEVVLIIFVIVAVLLSLYIGFSGSTDIPPEALENPGYGLPVERSSIPL